MGKYKRMWVKSLKSLCYFIFVLLNEMPVLNKDQIVDQPILYKNKATIFELKIAALIKCY